MGNDEAENWRRLGESVRRARIDIGYTNRENFAESCNISARVLADIEAGTRTNFSDRVLAKLEEGLSWPSGAVEQIVSDPSFDPPTPGGAGDLIFRPPAFNRRPVPVDVSLIERSIATLTEAERAGSETKPTELAVAAALVAQCWPYIVRLVEDNCLPGKELHPAVRPLFETFVRVADWAAPDDPSGRYARWLAGDLGDISESVRQRFMQRWSESRRVLHGRRVSETESAEPAALNA